MFFVFNLPTYVQNFEWAGNQQKIFALIKLFPDSIMYCRQYKLYVKNDQYTLEPIRVAVSS